MEEYELPTNITGEITVPAGYYVAPCDDYTMAFGAKVTFSPGSQLRIDAMSPFSLDAIAGFVYFEAGSSIAMSVMGHGTAIPFTEEVTTILDGAFSYNVEMGTGALMVFEATLSIADDSMVTCNKHILEFNGDTSFVAEVNVDIDMEDYDPSELDEIPMHVLVEAETIFGEIVYYPDGDDTETFVTISSDSYQSFYLEASNAAYSKTDNSTLDLQGSSKIILDIDGSEAVLTDETDLDIVITGDEPEDFDVDVSGKYSFEIDVDDYKGEILTIRDVAMSASVVIDNDDVTAKYKSEIGEISVDTMYSDFSLKGLEYSDGMTFEANSLSDLFSIQNILKEYAYMAEYNPSEAKDYIMACTGAMIEVYFGEEIAADFEELLVQLPPMALYALGFEDGYILSCVPDGTTLKAQFQRIYDGLGEDPDFTDYLSGCTDYILKVTYGIDEFVDPVLQFTQDFSLDYLMLDTEDYDLEVSGIELSSSVKYGSDYESKTESSYDGATAYIRYPTGTVFEVVLPAMSNSTFVDDEGITEESTVEGEFSVSAITFGGDVYVLSFEADANDTMYMNYEGLVTFSTNDEIMDFLLTGAGVSFSADYISYNMDVAIQVNDIDFPEYQDIDVAGLASYIRIVPKELGLDSFLAEASADSFLADYFLADDSLASDLALAGGLALADDLADDDGFSMDELAEYITIPPIQEIEIDADVEADVSFSFENVIAYVPDYQGMYYNATIGKFTADAEFTFVDEELEGSASASYRDCTATLYNSMMTINYNVDEMEMEGEVIADNIIAVEATGSMYVALGVGSDVSQVYVMDDIEAIAEIVYDMSGETEAELDSLSFDYVIIDQGITVDFGKVVYDVDSMTFFTNEVNIDGIFLNKGSQLYSMSGTVQDVYMEFEGMYPESYSITSADIIFNGTNGYVVWKQTVDERGNLVTCDVDGSFLLDNIELVPCVYDLIHPVILGGQSHYTFTGEGVAYAREAYFSEYGGTEMGGTAYALDEYFGGDLHLYLDFTGVVLGFDARGFMTVKALTGYTLDPSTYEGFTVGSDGYVVIDPEILAEGEGILSAEGVGDLHTLTIDGVSKPVHYGAEIVIEKGSNFLGMFNENGDAIGDVDGTTWYFKYYYDGDMTLYSISTQAVTVTPDRVVKLSDEQFNFTVPLEEFGAIIFETADGMIVNYASEDLVPGDIVRTAIEKTTFNGKDAFMIHCDHSMIIEYPVSGTDVVLYHVIRGVPVPMNCMYYVDDDGQAYAIAELSSFSTFYFDEKEGGKTTDTYFYLAAIAIALIVAVALCVPLYLRKRKAA